MRRTAPKQRYVRYNNLQQAAQSGGELIKENE